LPSRCIAIIPLLSASYRQLQQRLDGRATMCACVHQFVPVRIEVLQRTVDRGDHCARCDGSAGELIEVSTILLYRPAAGLRIIEGLAIEAEDPAAFGEFDLVAQAGGFPVADYAHSSDAAVS